MDTSHRNCLVGFTLVECTITLAILSLLAGLAMPTLHKIRKQAELRGILSSLTTELASARVSAVSRRAAYVLCPSDDGTSCTRDGRWDREWIGFHDGNRDHLPDSGAAIQSVHQHSTSGLSVYSGSGRPYVRYLPDGRSSGTNVTFRICNEGSVLARVVVNNAGRVRTELMQSPETCSNG